jgi:hypothetical protein
VANWVSVSVCSQGSSSSSHARTSSCRAVEGDCKTPSTSAWMRGSARVIVSTGTSTGSCAAEWKRCRVRMRSYLSSSRSSTIASFVIFAGGSTSPSSLPSYHQSVGLRSWVWGDLTHALIGPGLGSWAPLYIERKGVARICIVRMCVVTFWREAATIEAGETYVDTKRVILRRGVFGGLSEQHAKINRDQT